VKTRRTAEGEEDGAPHWSRGREFGGDAGGCVALAFQPLPLESLLACDLYLLNLCYVPLLRGLRRIDSVV
jgi:hypothetical protein